MNPTIKTLVKINEANAVSVLKTGSYYEMAHLVNGEVSYAVTNDVETFVATNKWELSAGVSELVADVAVEELTALGYTVEREVDQSIVISTFTYNIWIYVSYQDGKVIYDVATMNQNVDIDERDDANKQRRTTWKGLVNYINRFDK